MAKDITRELIIALLVLLAVILVLGLLLYGYMPNNKVIPEEITYTTSTAVKEVLENSAGVSEEEVVRTYSLDQTDLDNYQLTNDYRPGKTNPFSSYVIDDGENAGTDNGTSGENTGNQGQSGNSSSGGNTGNQGQSGNSSSGGTTNGGSSSGNTVDRTKPIAPGQVNPGNYTNNGNLK